MKGTVEHMPTRSLLFMRNTGAYGEQNLKLMQTLKDWIKSRGLWNERGTIYGIAQDNPAATPPEKCRYDVCFVFLFLSGVKGKCSLDSIAFT